jgi:hypothetical protein
MRRSRLATLDANRRCPRAGTHRYRGRMTARSAGRPLLLLMICPLLSACPDASSRQDSSGALDLRSAESSRDLKSSSRDRSLPDRRLPDLAGVTIDGGGDGSWVKLTGGANGTIEELSATTDTNATTALTGFYSQSSSQEVFWAASASRRRIGVHSSTERDRQAAEIGPLLLWHDTCLESSAETQR